MFEAVLPLKHGFSILYLGSRPRQQPKYNSEIHRHLTIVFEPADEGGYTAFIPEVPGAVSEGETVEEARAMVLDALRELTSYRREAALKGRTPATLIERIAMAF